MIVVEISIAEYHGAAYIGFARALRAVARGRRGDTGFVDGYVGSHVDGAVAEYAVAKTFGYFWPLGDRTDRADGDLRSSAGVRYEIRHTRRPDGRLVIHPEDPDHHYAILVRGFGTTLSIVGLALVENAKKPEFWRDEFDRPCFLVPETELLPLDGAVAA